MKGGQENWVKNSLMAGEKISAGWLQAASNITAEVMAEAGFDVLMIDMEHAPGDIQKLISQIQAMKGEQAVPFVRAPWNDFVQIKRILDAGVYGLLVPYVNSAEEASQAVKAAKYPVSGIRGVAGSPRAAHYGNNSVEYLKSAGNNIFVMTAVETPQAVENLDEILKIKELDGIFIGPMDLATNMGFFADSSAEEVKSAIADIESKVLSSGKTLATVSGTMGDAFNKYRRGYSLVVFMSDTTTLGAVAREKVDAFNKEFQSN